MAEDGTLVKANQDWFPLFVETNSIGDITFTSSNPGVIAIEPNDTLTDRAFVEGKTDYGVGAKAKVLSAGKTTITATIKGTGAYASVTKSFDVYIFPDLAKKPQLSMTETAYDTSRADGIIRPGDTLRMEVKLEKLRGSFAVASGAAYVGDKLAAQAEIKCAIGE